LEGAGCFLVADRFDPGFKIGNGFSDDERHNPPPIGSLVIIKYSGFYDSGIPRFPIFLGEGPEE